MFNPVADLKKSSRTLSNEAYAEIEKHPITAETKKQKYPK